MNLVGKFFLSCYRRGGQLKNKVFSLLISGAFAQFGKQTVVAMPLRLSGEGRISIGSEVFIGGGSWLQTLNDGDNESVAITIGDRTSIAGSCVISAVRSIVLEEAVLLARNVYISDHIHKYDETAKPILDQGVDRVAPVRIERGAWLGQNVVVCPGVRIGRGAVVGANSVVNQDVPEYSIAVGAPARVVKSLARAAEL